MQESSDRYFSVPDEFALGEANVRLDENTVELANYALDTVFWLAVIWMSLSAVRRVATGVISTRIARDDF